MSVRSKKRMLRCGARNSQGSTKFTAQDQSIFPLLAPHHHATGLGSPVQSGASVLFRSPRGSLVPYALSQRLKVHLWQRHRYTWAGRPSPDVTRDTADETLTKSVDLDERSIAASTGAASHRVMPRSASAKARNHHRHDEGHTNAEPSREDGVGRPLPVDVRHHDGTDDQVLNQFPHRGSLSGSASLGKVQGHDD